IHVRFTHAQASPPLRRPHGQSPGDVAERVSYANNFRPIISRGCVSHSCVASSDTRSRTGPISSQDPGTSHTRRATHTGALSSSPRGCLLPAVLGVRRIPYRAMTGAPHGPPLPPLGRRDPARIRARDNVARWGELHVVTAEAGTAQRHRLGLPDLIMPVD